MLAVPATPPTCTHYCSCNQNLETFFLYFCFHCFHFHAINYKFHLMYSKMWTICYGSHFSFPSEFFSLLSDGDLIWSNCQLFILLILLPFFLFNFTEIWINTGGRRKRRRRIKKGFEEQGTVSGPRGVHRTRGEQQRC